MPDLPVLDRVPHFDEQSKQYPIRKLLAEPTKKTQRIWAPRVEGPLDQGSEGRCVAFGWAGELAATPQVYKVNDNWVNTVSWPLVQAEDRKMGNNWTDGASVLAGAKAMQGLNKVRYYAWAFGTDDVLQTLMRKGPVIIGINWYESMYETRLDGLVNVSGPNVGGHCIMVNGYIPKHPTFGECVIWTNSWGRTYGVNGRGYVKVEDLDRLLKEDGEACIPTDMPVKL